MGEAQLSEPPRSRSYARAGDRPIGLTPANAERRQATHTGPAQNFWVVPQGSTFWARPDAAHSPSAANRTATAAPLAGMFGRVLAALRSWQHADRSWSDLQGLNDSVLKDIGLHREDLGRGCVRPHWYTD